MSLLPNPVSVVVNKPDDFLLRLLSVQSQAQQSPNCLGPAYPAVPLASVLCINIYLHQWLYCTDREEEREEEYAPIRACAIVFCCSETVGSAVTLWPTSRLGSTHPALSVLPLSHHASFCPTSLLLCHRPLFVYRHCAISPCILVSLSLKLTLLMFSSPLRLSPRVSSPCLSVCRAHRLTFFLCCPLSLSEHSLSLPLHLPHEDSAPAEVDELSQPQRAGEE